MSSLFILDASVLRYRADKQTNTGGNPIPATAVGVNNKLVN